MCLTPYLADRRRVTRIASWKVCERSRIGIDFENMRFVEEVRVTTFERPQQWLKVTYSVFGGRFSDRHKKGRCFSSPTLISLFGSALAGKSCLLQLL
jgi:hypothetical protein